MSSILNTDGGKSMVALSELDVDDGDAPVINPDPVWTGARTAFGEWWATRRRRTKRKKLARKGYVEWHLVEGTFSGPAYVKPNRTGTGVPELDHGGVTYMFPEQASIPSELSGMQCYIHRAGEIDPINLRDPVDHAIAPDQFQEYADMSLQTSSPSWLGDLSFSDILWYGLIATIVAAVAWSAMNGGLA